MKENTFKMVTEDGQEITCNVLFTFDSEETGKSYIAYDGNPAGKEVEQIICVASYDPNVDLNKLEPVTDSEELKMVNDVISQIMED